MSLLELAERCEGASADEQATLLIEAFDLIDWRSKPGRSAGITQHNPRWFKFDKMIRAEAYESAAMMLVPEGDDISGERFRLEHWNAASVIHAAHVRATAWVPGAIRVYAASPALALTAASLRARSDTPS